jgi:hypothetical protein
MWLLHHTIRAIIRYNQAKCTGLLGKSSQTNVRHVQHSNYVRPNSICALSITAYALAPVHIASYPLSALLKQWMLTGRFMIVESRFSLMTSELTSSDGFFCLKW